MKKIKIITIIFLWLNLNTSVAQIPDAQYVNATTAANIIMGNGVQIVSASFIGDNRQLGKFWDGAKFGFPEGVGITTGDVKLIEDYNNSNISQSRPVRSGQTNGDIAQAVNASLSNTKDAATLEIKFIPFEKSFSLDYVFASDEYPEEVCCPYNDAMLILLNGPGIAGTFTNSAINIARTPNGNFPVSMNTINGGAGYFSSARCPCPTDFNLNSNYYRDNPFSGTLGQAQTEQTAQLVYDGLTTVLAASYNDLQCGEEYTLRISIANLMDSFKDSGVFIKKGSLSTNGNVGDIFTTVTDFCRMDKVKFQIPGDPSYTYTWSNGQSGVGLKQVNVLLFNQTKITCKVKTPSGCEFEKTYYLSIENCCKTPLTFIKSGITYIQNETINGVNTSTTIQSFKVDNDVNKPIVEMRLVITDVFYDYNYGNCAMCINNPALWGSVNSPTTALGNTPQLQQQSQIYNTTNFLNNNRNLREVIWGNPNGVMLKDGDVFDIKYHLPPSSNIPCCATKVTLCQEISWKDTDCKICTYEFCDEFEINSSINQ